MKLVYSQAKNTQKKEPNVYEVSLYTNPIDMTANIPFIIPTTFDYISGFKITNNNDEPCEITVSWSTTIIETFSVDANTTTEIYIPKLYIFMVSTGIGPFVLIYQKSLFSILFLVASPFFDEIPFLGLLVKDTIQKYHHYLGVLGAETLCLLMYSL